MELFPQVRVRIEFLVCDHNIEYVLTCGLVNQLVNKFENKLDLEI
jgi:hypothetical protein